jgi:hypothetical protein
VRPTWGGSGRPGALIDGSIDGLVDRPSPAPSPTQNTTPKRHRPVDVFTTHLSLSHLAREAAAVEIQAWASQRSSAAYQFLLGDFNAEPQEKSFRFLVGADPEAELRGHTGNWTDAWTAAELKGGHGGGAQGGLTFPSWRPEKRIDFVLYRAQRPESERDGMLTCPAVPAMPKGLRVAQVELVGTKPTEGTEHLGGASMLEPGSPVFASDHLGVYARFEVVS